MYNILQIYGKVEITVVNAYFCPHSVFNSGYLIEFVCLKMI